MSSALLADMPRLVSDANLALSRVDLAAIKASARPSVRCVIDKVSSRKAMSDSDLAGVNPMGLLQLAWEETERTPDGDGALSDLLEDMGGTCLQGDTHRLFFYVRALRLSKSSS